jgi:hypothetical protein
MCVCVSMCLCFRVLFAARSLFSEYHTHIYIIYIHVYICTYRHAHSGVLHSLTTVLSKMIRFLPPSDDDAEVQVFLLVRLLLLRAIQLLARVLSTSYFVWSRARPSGCGAVLCAALVCVGVLIARHARPSGSGWGAGICGAPRASGARLCGGQRFGPPLLCAKFVVLIVLRLVFVLF